MQSSRDIKRRLQTVSDTGKIAKAMKAVSVSKLKRAQQAMEHAASYSRHYAVALKRSWCALETKRNILVGVPDLAEVPICLLVVSSDRGLCGAYNQRVLDTADRFMDTHHVVDVCALGRRAVHRLHRRGREVLGYEATHGEHPPWDAAKALARYMVNSIRRQRAGAVVVVQNTFVNAMHYETEARCLLPFDIPAAESEEASETEPKAPHLFRHVAGRAVAAELHHWLWEAVASEHAARMVAMSDAYDNCEELGHKLVRDLNKLRQAGITKELLEIVSGAEALNARD